MSLSSCLARAATAQFQSSFDHEGFLRHVREEYRGYCREHPHIRQAFVGGYPLRRVLRPFALADRLLTEATPRSQRRGRGGEVKTTEHWGQRKLLMSEIEFLSRF